MTDRPTSTAPSSAPGGRPGDVIGLPKLVLRYPTDPDAIAALLPPGLDMHGDPVVQINIYCVPVHGEPEYGISTKVPARFDGTAGSYCLGIGIDQESAIFVSRETNGQPKFPCKVRYFSLGDEVNASATHQGTNFLSYRGAPVATPEPDGSEVTEYEWWIKFSRAVGGVRGYDLEPRVVRVTTSGIRVHTEVLEGDLTLRESRWDPYTALLPMLGAASAELVTTRHTGRSIDAVGRLDPDSFWPFTDTIGGSRWPGERGAPRPFTSKPGGRP